MPRRGRRPRARTRPGRSASARAAGARDAARPVDDPALLEAAAADAGLDPGELHRWTAAEAVGEALEADVGAARDPSPAARALDHKLGGPDDARRYTAPSYVIDGVAIPGFNPVETYETAIANRDPALHRRPRPADVAELLAWAGEPLATAEVALVMQVEIEAARRALRAAGASWHPAGADGYWTLAA